MNSHIQMPRFMLKRFENERHELYYYDVNTNVIAKGYPRSINTEDAYYSDEMESLLNRDIETPFSLVLKYIDTIDFEADSFNLLPGFEDRVKTFLKSLFARSPKIANEIDKKSLFSQFFNIQSQHDATVLAGMEEVTSQGLFDDFFPTFSVNKSGIPFVLPICGFYGFMYKGIKHINLPIDPWKAITLIDKNEVGTIIKDNLVHLYLINKEMHSRQLNWMAFENQIRQGYGRVISGERKVLEDTIRSENIEMVRRFPK